MQQQVHGAVVCCVYPVVRHRECMCGLCLYRAVHSALCAALCAAVMSAGPLHMRHATVTPAAVFRQALGPHLEVSSRCQQNPMISAQAKVYHCV
jgi:hypothetical protein